MATPWSCWRQDTLQPSFAVAGVYNDNRTKEEAYLRESPTYIISKEFQVQWSWPLHRM